MDALLGLLDQPRARGAFLLRSMLTPSWSLRIEDEAPLSVVTMARGTALIVPAVGEPAWLGPGDIAILRGPDPYTICDTPKTPVQIVIHPGQRCTSVDGLDMAGSMNTGVRTWGTSRDGSADTMLSGTYQLHSEVSQRLLRMLPPLMVRPIGTGERSLVDLLAVEIVRDEPGQELVLDRLLDLLVITVLRSWLASPDVTTAAWYRAQRDPVIGAALQMLHADPAYNWTVADLAASAGVSRAALARRFTDLVGEPPMKYLANWRLTLAADLLCEPHATVGNVARLVGYGSAFALSTAFKRVRGVSPLEHRRGVLGQRRTQEDGDGLEE
ncbi:AraC family transcriptional regulator [Dactylosporangium sp. CA-139066]|uniref:AraC family transcriptional regulator n=1 Tax=Dactylosporangium sp. CA-139066 TaxID=3239930 RepID=UPI003D94FD9F